MVDSNNLLDPSLDISGSLIQKDDLVQGEEALKLGSRITGQFGANASIAHSVGITTVSGLSGITANSVGRYLTLSGANTGANNGNFLIQSINSPNSVNIKNPNGVSDSNNGNISWVERNVYSLQDDLNYERTDRSEIKGVDYSDPVPTYYKANNSVTAAKASLANIAGNTTDAKAVIVNKKYQNAPVVNGASYMLLTGSPGDFPYATTINKLGLPIYDGSDGGNVEACYCEIIYPATGQELKVLNGINAGKRIFGLSREGSTGIDGESFEIELRCVNPGQSLYDSVSYIWEVGLPNIVNVFFPFRQSLSVIDENALRSTLVEGLFATDNGGGGGSGDFGGIFAGTQLASSGFVTFANSNGISFGMSNSSLITASYTVPSTAGLISRVNISAGTTSNNVSNFVFSNSNNVSFGLNGSTITATVTVPSQTSLSFSNQNGVSFGLNGSTLTASVAAQTAQTQSNVQGISAAGGVARTGDVVFSNSNGLAFGLNGNTITGSYTVPTQTAYQFSNSNGISFGTNGSTVTASYTVPNVPAQTSLSFSNSNGISFGVNGSTLTASYTVPSTAGLISNVNVSAGTTSGNLTNFVFSNSNNVSFGLNGSTITGSVPSQTNQTEGRYAVGNTTGQSSSSTFDARSLSISGAGNVSVGYSGNALIISGAGGGGNGSINFSAGTTSNNLNAITFSNSNGISFGLNGSTITGSYSTLVFSNSNGISFGINNGTLTATVNPGAAAGIAAIQGGTQTATSGTVSFADSNGISFGMAGSSRITASYTVPSTAGLISAINISGGTTSNNLAALTFSNSNNVSFGLNGSVLTASVPTQTSLSFSNQNGISFGLNGSTLTASYTVPNVPAQSNQTAGLYALGNTTQNSSTTLDVRSLSFNGLGNVSVGYSNGSIQISGSQSAQTVQTQNIVLPSAGTQTANSGTVVFANSNGITFGMSGSSQITASYTVPSTAGLISNINVSAGTTSNNVSNFVFSNSNNVSFGLNGSTITATISVPNQTVQTIGAYASGNTTGQSSSSTFDARSLSVNGAGAVSVGYSAGSLVVSAPTQTSLSYSNVNNVTFGIVGSTLTASVPNQTSLSYSNANGVTFGLNGSTLTASIPSTAGLISGINISAGTTSNNLTALTFSNSNGLAFGLNGSVITGSYTVPTQTNQTEGRYVVGNTTGQSSSSTFDARTMSISGAGNVSVGYSAGNLIISATAGAGSLNVSAGTTSNNLTALTFSNSNGVSFGLNGSTVTASIASQTNQTAGFYAVGNTTGQSSSSTFDARTLSFSGAGIASVGYSGNNIIINVPAAGASVNISAGTTSGNLNAVTFGNSNGVSFGLSNGVITATVIPGAAAGIGAVQAGTQTQTSGTLVFANSNGITFGLSGSSQITASYTVPSTVGLISGVNVSAGTTSNNLTALTFSNSNGLSFGLNGSIVTGSYTVPNVPAQTAQTVGLYAVSNTTGASSSTTIDARSLSFQGAGVASVGYTNGSVVISVPSGNANINISAGTTSNNVTNFVFSNSNNVSFGLNGSTVTATISVPVQTAQTVGLYGLGNTTQNSSTTLDARSLSFNGLGGATVGYSNGSIQISGVTTAGLISGVNVSAGTTSNNLTAVTFSNSNGLSFGLNGSVITGSYTVPTQTNQTEGRYAIGNTTGQSSSSTFDARTMSISGAGDISVGYSGNALLVSGSQSAQTQNIVVPSAGTQSATSGTVIFSNSNGISFGMSNSSVITASYTVPSTAGLISGINVSAGTTSNNLTALTFSNSNGLSFGLNGSVITGSYTIPAQTNQTIGLYGLGNTTQNSSTTLDARSISYNGLGIVTVGYSNGSVQISATQSNQTEGRYAIGNTVGQSSSSTFDARTMSISGAGIVSVGYSGNALVISAPSAGGSVNFSAGTTSNNLNAITFSNANGVSFGLNGSTLTASIPNQTFVFSNSNNVSFGVAGSTITATATFAQTVQTVGLYALGNTTQNSSTTLDARSLSFNGIGAASVGYSNGSIQISVPTQTVQTQSNIQAIYDGANSISTGTIRYSNANGVSFGINGQTLTASVAAQSNQTAGLYALGNTTQNSSTTLDIRSLSFNGLGGATVGYSNGSIQISAVTTANLISRINISAGTTSNNLSAFTLSNSNGLAFGLNGSVITGSYTVPTQSAQTIGLYAVSNTTGASSSSTVDARSLSFQGVGNVSVGYTNGSVVISGAGGGGGGSSVNISAGTTSNNLTNFVFSNSNSVSFGLSGSTITASIPNQTFVFSNSNNISFGVAGSTITASAGRPQMSQLMWPEYAWETNFPVANATFSMQHFNAKADIIATQANLLAILSGNTNSSGALTVSLGIYTMSGSTMSLASSDSRVISWTSGSQTTIGSIYGGVSGTRYRTVSLNNWSVSAGDYMLGMWFRTTNNGTWNIFGIQGPTIVGALDANETNNYCNGLSNSSYSTGMIASINVTNTNYVRTGGNALQQPGIVFLGSY